MAVRHPLKDIDMFKGFKAVVHCGKQKSNEGLDKIANDTVTTSYKLLNAPSMCNKVTNDTFPSVAEDQII